MDRLKIFISSTYRDLAKYRERVIRQLLHMKQIPIAMEYFGSQPGDPTGICFKEIEECDVFVGIYGFYYGYTPGEGSPSITEQEFAYARDLGKRCLCYFAEESLKPELQGKTGSEPEIKQQGLTDFKNRIDKELVRSFFHSADDLGAKLGADLNLLLQGEPIGLVYDDVVKKWLKWETDLKIQVCAEEFNGKNMPFDYNSPLSQYWYKFAAADSWHNKLSGLAESIRNAVKSLTHLCAADKPFLPLTRELKKIDWTANYHDIISAVAASLKSKIDNALSVIQTVLENDAAKNNPANIDYHFNLFNLRDTLQKFKVKIETPSYNKCFLAVGSIGSGKTHLIASLMGERDTGQKGQNYLILKLAAPYNNNETLEELILKGIQIAGGVSWRSLEDFDAFLKKAYNKKNTPEFKLANAIGGSNLSLNIPKLVVTIDDLHKWISWRPGFLNELIRFIFTHTRLHSIYWLLTIDYNCYHYLSRNDLDMFLTYSWIDTRETFHENPAYPAYPETPAQPIYHIAGWFVLDEYNIMTGVGLQVLRRELGAENGESSLALDYISRDEAILRKIAPPFMAWTLLELKGELPLTDMVNLNYIEVVERFWIKRTSSLNKKEETLLRQCTIFIARYFVETKDFSPVFTRLKNKIAADGEGICDLQERSKLESTLTKLAEANLMSTFEAEENAIPVEKVQIKQETFWEWRLAERLLASEGIAEQQVTRVQAELETWFAGEEWRDIKEGIFEFMLLMLNPGLNKDDAVSPFSEEFWTLGLRSEHLPTPAVWFAASKAPVFLQKKLIQWIAKSRYRPAAKRELFAYMHFLCEASPGVMDVRDRLKFLQKNFSAIQKNDFIYYYFFIVRKMITAITDNRLLVSCMVLCRGCEVLGIADRLATLAVHRLIDNVRAVEGGPRVNEKTYDGVFEFIKQYLTGENKYARYDYNKIKKENPQQKWQRYFFREWVLYEFTHYLAGGKTVFDFFAMLGQWKWFNPEYFGFSHQVALEMEREATIAAGWSYRTGFGPLTPEGNPVETAIENLLAKKQVRERKLAFYLIRHTIAAEGDVEVKVNPALRPFLKKIYLDPEMKRIVKSFPKFFQCNLSADHKS
ncbi:MAG: hypothetical protein QG657_1885 [Acidobacteriota bacterium]|nr:hypothetical protein [Acidobacteriota bacterium]